MKWRMPTINLLRLVGEILFGIGWVLEAYALFQAFVVGPYAAKTLDVDSIAIISIFLIGFGFWLIVRKQKPQNLNYLLARFDA